jgi:hypothetical protein
MPSQFVEFQVDGHPARINRDLVTMLIGGTNKAGPWTRIHFDKDHFAIVRENIEQVATILEMKR